MHRSRVLTLLLTGALLTFASLFLNPPAAQAAVPDAPHCSTSGTWRQNEFNIYWFDVDLSASLED